MATNAYIGTIVVVVILLAIVGFFFLKNPGGAGGSELPRITSYAALTNTCSDSDGEDTKTPGVTIAIADKQSKTHIDRCVTENSVLEGICEKGELVKKQITCAKSCNNGICTE